MKSGKLEYVLNRLLQMLIVLWAVATILFLIFRLMPGNPLVAYIDPTFTKEQQDALLRQFGLDQPLYVQYIVYLKNLVQGELGDSFFYRDPVAKLLWDVFPNTIMLTGWALLIAYTVGVLGGVLLAWKRGTWVDDLGTTITLITRAAPEFWVGMLALAVFSFGLGWFPASGASSPGSQYPNFWAQLASRDFWQHLFLPAATLATYLVGLPLLLMRSNLLEVMDEDFVVMARMKGYSNWRVLMIHAARNALLPVATAMALGIGYAVGGNVVIETVFSWPGIGRLLVKAVAAKDYPLAQGAFFLIACVMIFMNFVADLLYTWLDPRVSHARR